MTKASRLREEGYLPGNEHLFRDALEHARNSNFSALDGLDLGVGMISSKKQFIYVNAKFCEITGYTSVELVGQAPAMLFTKEDFPKMLINMQSIAEAEGLYVNGTPLCYLRKDRSKIMCQFAGHKVNVSGEPCLIGFLKEGHLVPPSEIDAQ